MVEYNWYKALDKIEQRNYQIARANDSLYQIGDTVIAYLKIHFSEDKVKGIAYPGKLLSEGDKNDSINRMKLAGIIIDKGFEEQHPACQDSTSIFFDLKIMKLSKDDVSVGGKMLQVGDTFKLLVTHYGGLLDSL